MSATKEHYHDQIEAGQRGKQHPIGWLNMPGYKPETWNPIVGCSKVSPACDHCFAERMANRLSGIEKTPQYKSVITNGKWNGKTELAYNQLNWPAVWKSPRMIFTVDMGDLFHESVPFEWIDAVFTVMSDCDQHIYVLLTKRPERILEFFCWKILQSGFNWRPKDNIWFGATVENQEQANIRIPLLLKVPAAIRFVSVEPMLGQIDFYDIVINTEFYHILKGFGDISGGDFKKFNGPKLDWVICGGESGPKARPMHPEWVKSVRDQCKDAGTPFFFKQWGTWCPEGTKENYSFLIPSKEKLMGNEVMTKKPVVRNHDQLDGLQHHEWPKINL